MLAQRRRRWTNINLTLVLWLCLVSAGTSSHHFTCNLSALLFLDILTSFGDNITDAGISFNICLNKCSLNRYVQKLHAINECLNIKIMKLLFKHSFLSKIKQNKLSYLNFKLYRYRDPPLQVDENYYIY